MKIQKYKGVRDFYPEDMLIQNHIFNAWKKVCKSYGYKEIEGPIIEPLELFTKKSGDEIESQLYNFKDKGGRDVTLRPETTPSVARFVVQKQKELKKPIKWFSNSRCFRYEQPQSGRLRSFYQLNVDCLGLDKAVADSEVINVATKCLIELGLNEKDFFIRLNHRGLLNSILDEIKVKDKKELFKLIDKKEKINVKDFENGLKKLGLGFNEIKIINKLFEIESIDDIKNLGVKYDEKSLKDFNEVVNYLESFGLGKYVNIDMSIVRGFDYYTGIVFELFDKSGDFRALAGGGRYDDLTTIFGGEKCPGIGFGMGDVVLGLFLEKKGLFKNLKLSVDYFIGIMDKEYINDAIKISEKLRSKGSVVEIDLSCRNLKKQMNYANSINAKNMIIIGSKEIESREFFVKDMKSGKEKKVKISEL